MLCFLNLSSSFRCSTPRGMSLQFGKLLELEVPKTWKYFNNPVSLGFRTVVVPGSLVGKKLNRGMKKTGGYILDIISVIHTKYITPYSSLKGQ